MKKILIAILSVLFILNSESCVFAVNNPLDVPNNKFGIHIMDEKDLNDAANLVNSSGGDWGYVTVVITESERDHNRWQSIFDQMRRLHLIPIVRIASRANGDIWEVPQDAEINNWIAFLNSLNWVIQNRYVIIGNEPNHDNEWGGSVNPEEYATYLYNFAGKLHDASNDFFVLSAGFDASAKNITGTMEESKYIKRMLVKEPNLFDRIDGWVSHSYPNPNFSGNASDIGKGTVKTYDWESTFLVSLGITKNLPIFITETGWSNSRNDQEKISNMYEYVFKNVWNDKRIVAVTPFILNYPNTPFSEFSWKKSDGDFYSYYLSYKNIPKTRGSPVQKESGQILGALSQPIILTDSDFVGVLLAKNTGQSIWSTDNISIIADNSNMNIRNSLIFDIEPSKTGLIIFRSTPDKKSGILLKSIYLTDSKGKRMTNSFTVEGLIIKANKMQVQDFFAKIGSFFYKMLGAKK